MENNQRIRDVKVFTKDGEMMISYYTGKNGENYHERPMYNEKGEIDPEVQIIMFKAKELSEKETEALIEGEVSDEQISSDSVALIPTEKGNITVYNAPENAELDKSFMDKYGRLIGVGLAGVLIGVTIMALAKGCESDKNQVILPKPNTDNDSSIEQDVETIKYISKEDYITGVKDFTESLNANYGFAYQPSQLTSFYYVANMENISDELFEDLVTEGYIPDTISKLLANTFEVTGSVRTKNLQTGTSNIDYEKLFVDEEMAEVAETWEEKYNSCADLESTTAVLTELEDFVVVAPESGYNELPTGGREIFNWTIGESIYTKAEFTGVEATEALKTESNDMTTVMTVYNNGFACITEETEKQLTK